MLPHIVAQVPDVRNAKDAICNPLRTRKTSFRATGKGFCVFRGWHGQGSPDHRSGWSCLKGSCIFFKSLVIQLGGPKAWGFKKSMVRYRILGYEIIFLQILCALGKSGYFWLDFLVNVIKIPVNMKGLLFNAKAWWEAGRTSDQLATPFFSNHTILTTDL